MSRRQWKIRYDLWKKDENLRFRDTDLLHMHEMKILHCRRDGESLLGENFVFVEETADSFADF